MITESTLSKMLFFDIESRGKYPTFKEFQANDPAGAYIWEKKSARQYKDMTAEQSYEEKVSLYPEFGVIACLSYGVWKNGEMTISTISNEDEETTIKLIANLFHKAGASFLSPTGWNIKNFDIPWIIRKMLIYGISVPDAISTYNKKPWETVSIDLKDVWKSFCSIDCNFEEATYALGIPSPKDDIDGSQVHSEYWNGNIERIKTYCEKDVKAMIQMCEQLAAVKKLSLS